jgi:acetolactate synthase I/II/III large subunit
VPPKVLEPDDGKVRLSDWLMGKLVESGISDAFMVAGGAAMYLNDAVALNPEITVTAMLHEQAAAIAAETYAKAAGRLALCLVTAGPGGTNAITGLAGGWLDSTPMIVCSGQAKTADLVGGTGVRQRGVQEVDIVSIVRSLTKYAVLLDDPTMVRYHVERALYLATSGRPGPVWIDVPLDVQAARIDPDALMGFDPSSHVATGLLDRDEIVDAAESVAEALAAATRPLLLVGAGVRLAGAEEQVLRLVESSGVPVLATWPAQGVVGDQHPCYVGRPGPLAPRGANFALQNSDFILGLGARMDLVTTGYNPKDFGRNARKFVVDIDPRELAKLDGAVERGICADVGDFLAELQDRIKPNDSEAREGWRQRCVGWRTDYPVVTGRPDASAGHVSTYHFAHTLSELIEADDVLVPCSSGLGIEIFQLALRLHTGQRVISTTALGGMGFGPPSAVGACIGSGGRRTICVDGDGGFQLNIQELETIRRMDLPIKLIVMMNEGYASIRASQKRWFGRVIGADSSSGLTLPPLEGVASAYRIPYVRIDPAGDLAAQLEYVLSQPGPILCELPTPPDEPREPGQISEATADGGMRSRPLEDLAPLLTREELAENMLRTVLRSP